MQSIAYGKGEILSLAAIVTLMMLNPILAEIVKPQDTTSLVFTVELFKFLLSGSVVIRQHKEMPISIGEGELRMFLYLLVPSLAYAIMNNLVFHAVAEIGPLNVQVVGQLKLLLTGIFSVTLLGRHLNGLQWAALVVLTCGVVTGTVEGDFTLDMPFEGFLKALFIVAISVLSGVFTEWCFKSKQVTQSVWLRNAQMYFHGMWVNAVAAIVTKGTLPDVAQVLFRPTSPLQYALLSVQTLMGTSIGWLLKFHSSIVKNYLAAVAMTLISVFDFMSKGKAPTVGLLICITLVFCAVYMTNYEKPS